MRYSLGLAVVVGGLLLAIGSAGADTAKKHFTPGNNDPTVGVLGAHKGQSEAGGLVRPNAVPPAPIPAVPPPSVQAEQPVVGNSPTTPSSSLAAPRPDAHIEGSTGDAYSQAPAHPAQVNTFLASHPFVSGVVAGLIGTDLGSVIYGGPMMGDENAAMIGFMIRVLLVVLLAVFAVRLVWRMVGKADDDDLAPPDSRREPSFGRQADFDGGRREPTFGRPAGRSDEPTPLRPRQPAATRRR